jgi:hypothetical protein
MIKEMRTHLNPTNLSNILWSTMLSIFNDKRKHSLREILKIKRIEGNYNKSDH